MVSGLRIEGDVTAGGRPSGRADIRPSERGQLAGICAIFSADPDLEITGAVRGERYAGPIGREVRIIVDPRRGRDPGEVELAVRRRVLRTPDVRTLSCARVYQRNRA